MPVLCPLPSAGTRLWVRWGLGARSARLHLCEGYPSVSLNTAMVFVGHAEADSLLATQVPAEQAWSCAVGTQTPTSSHPQSSTASSSRQPGLRPLRAEPPTFPGEQRWGGTSSWSPGSPGKSPSPDQARLLCTPSQIRSPCSRTRRFQGWDSRPVNLFSDPAMKWSCDRRSLSGCHGAFSAPHTQGFRRTSQTLLGAQLGARPAQCSSGRSGEVAQALDPSPTGWAALGKVPNFWDVYLRNRETQGFGVGDTNGSRGSRSSKGWPPGGRT